MTVAPEPEETDNVRSELLKSIFQQLIDGVIKGATHRPYGDVYVRLFPLHRSIDILVSEPEDADVYPQGSLDSLVPLAEEARELQYLPETGAWTYLTFEIDAEGEIRISVSFDGHPVRLAGELLSPEPVVDDLEKHPRDTVPEWLAEAIVARRLAGSPEESAAE